VEQSVREDEIRDGDISILAGQHIIIVGTLEEDCQPRMSAIGGLSPAMSDVGDLSMMNYLRVMGVEEQSSSRRRANRNRPPNVMVLSTLR